MIRTLLIPGLDGSPAPHWQHWWAATDPGAKIVEQQSWSKPSLEAWVTELANAAWVHPNSVLVGHSLGAITAVRLLASWPQIRIAGALLVAPAEPDRCPRIAGFGPIPERALHHTAMVVASRNDPWMGQDRARHLARSWGAEFVDMGPAGHINTEAGFGPWPEGKALASLLRSLGAAQAAPAMTAI
ncbi:MAG: alpha/beta hydrolase [Paracoccus sp. (in: a-proteobacteria)]|nr:alpha/beta hydrolase [Paracoccus sp. (in: a-proteobacteria)]